jgi:hypothetical protein
MFSTLPLVVVGGVNLAGQRTWYSQGDASQLDSSAVSDVVCPTGSGPGLEWTWGTSYGMP